MEHFYFASYDLRNCSLQPHSWRNSSCFKGESQCSTWAGTFICVFCWTFARKWLPYDYLSLQLCCHAGQTWTWSHYYLESGEVVDLLCIYCLMWLLFGLHTCRFHITHQLLPFMELMKKKTLKWYGVNILLPNSMVLYFLLFIITINLIEEILVCRLL